ncbi:MAG: hypothetical protein DRJ01_18525 [Bacteroidetes bacterium]|nr:MAG: hypothetical protein DRJ01_18525 [Bacteroidota bacterium]
MKVHFRLYANSKSDYKSTLFDLISGDKETKQTKGFAYVLSQNKSFLLKFLEIGEIKEKIYKTTGCRLNKKSISSIEINAEKITTTKKRADIVIKVNRNDKPYFALIIEAKSVKSSNKNVNNIVNQISNYLKHGEIEDLDNYKKIGVLLTKYKHNVPDIVCIDWNYIINFILGFCKKNDDKLINQYLHFIINIDKGMKYYEKEVLSIPASKSTTYVEKFHIYECPNNKNYSYKKPLFVTFRKKGGVMEYLYKIEDIIVFNPSINDELIAFKNSTISTDIKNNILNYIDDLGLNNIVCDEKRFYALSESDIIELMHRPIPKGHLQKHTYYSLRDILTEKKLTPVSQK